MLGDTPLDAKLAECYSAGGRALFPKNALGYRIPATFRLARRRRGAVFDLALVLVRWPLIT